MKKLISILVVIGIIMPILFTSCKGKNRAGKVSNPKSETSTLTKKEENKIPASMLKSIIILSDQIYGEEKTVNDLFGKPKDTTKVVITSSKNELKISSSIMKNDTVALKYDVTFIFSDNGTCYPSTLYYEKPSTFQSDTIKCNGGPYNDPYGFGQVFGWLKELIPISYD